MSEYTTKDVREFITKILITGGILKVDDEGIIYWKGAEDEVAVVDLDGGKGILHTYTVKATHPDAVIINPFCEALTMSIDRNWFYKVTSNIFAQSLIRVMRTLIVLAQEKEKHTYPDLLPYLTPIVGKIDDKVLDEFNYIVEVGTKDFCSLVYNSRAKETKLFLGIEDPTGDFQKSIPASKVRKKTWALLQTLLKTIFGTEGPVSQEMIASTCLIHCPQFRTYMEVWIKCWRAIEPVTVMTDPINEELPDLLDDIEKHVEFIDGYFKLCQWSGQSSATQAVKSAVKKTYVPGTKAEPATVHVPQPETRASGPLPGPSTWDSPTLKYAPSVPAPAPAPMYRQENRWEQNPAPGYYQQPSSHWDSPKFNSPQTQFGNFDPRQETVFGRPYGGGHDPFANLQGPYQSRFRR